MKSLNHAVGTRVICSRTYLLDSKEICKGRKRENSNWAPQSVVMVVGTSKTKIHWAIKVRATVSAVISGMGASSGQRV